MNCAIARLRFLSLPIPSSSILRPFSSIRAHLLPTVFSRSGRTLFKRTSDSSSDGPHGIERDLVEEILVAARSASLMPMCTTVLGWRRARSHAKTIKSTGSISPRKSTPPGPINFLIQRRSVRLGSPYRAMIPNSSEAIRSLIIAKAMCCFVMKQMHEPSVVGPMTVYGDVMSRDTNSPLWWQANHASINRVTVLFMIGSSKGDRRADWHCRDADLRVRQIGGPSPLLVFWRSRSQTQARGAWPTRLAPWPVAIGQCEPVSLDARPTVMDHAHSSDKEPALTLNLSSLSPFKVERHYFHPPQQVYKKVQLQPLGLTDS
jgi:hypothetical protein